MKNFKIGDIITLLDYIDSGMPSNAVGKLFKLDSKRDSVRWYAKSINYAEGPHWGDTWVLYEGDMLLAEKKYNSNLEKELDELNTIGYRE